jgi:uncharacterized protein (DUF433 family)
MQRRRLLLKQYTVMTTTYNPITVDADIVSGTPVFTGTRVPVQSLFDWLETETMDEFLENFPSVQRSQAVEVLKSFQKI